VTGYTPTSRLLPVANAQSETCEGLYICEYFINLEFRDDHNV